MMKEPEEDSLFSGMQKTKPVWRAHVIPSNQFWSAYGKENPGFIDRFFFRVSMFY